MMLPQVACGGWTPKPRKLRLASVRIASGMPRTAVTIIGAAALGRIWRKMISRDALAERAGRTHVFAFTQGEKLRAHQSRRSRPAYEANHHNDIDDIRTKQSDGGEDEKEGRKTEDGIDDAHDHVVNPSAKITRKSRRR